MTLTRVGMYPGGGVSVAVVTVISAVWAVKYVCCLVHRLLHKGCLVLKGVA